ncbi:MAG TPA: cbb3-type cytochrome c oxidase subunit 3 [Rhizobiales bacterium]|nr:cbb3-type cytochrome c oxidase subunit 3 [Hyphomicrobiales bacterium]
MDHATITQISGIAGLFIFMVMFAIVLVYALWPRNKKKFDHAAHLPLEED